jgi:two-component system sensor histidine kinase DegS
MANDVIISDSIARATYHILIESLNNIRKHAQATIVTIGLSSQEENLCLVVEDDGVGSSVAALSLPDLVRRRHFGLADMYEWANMINGELVFSCRDGGGTRVSLTVPPPWRRA